jgi:hypothetical protein
MPSHEKRLLYSVLKEAPRADSNSVVMRAGIGKAQTIPPRTSQPIPASNTAGPDCPSCSSNNLAAIRRFLSDLFCPPSSVGVSHIQGRFDLRCKLQGAVGQSNPGHDQTGDKPKCIALNDDGTNEYIDCTRVSFSCRPVGATTHKCRVQEMRRESLRIEGGRVELEEGVRVLRWL